MIGARTSESPKTCTHKTSNTLFKNSPVTEYDTYVFSRAFQMERSFPSSTMKTILLFQ